MTFFARPDLSNEQFKQLTGSTLTLSGTTQIASIGGLSLADGAGGFIPIIAVTGSSTIGDVLTLNNDGTIRLLPSGAGAGTYLGASPTTCTVGGLNAGTPISGCTFQCILQTILVPALNPTLTPPSTTFTLTPATILYEVGSSVSLTGTTCFNRGCINPQYTSLSDKRTGLVNCYCYAGNIAPTSVSSTGNSVVSCTTIASLGQGTSSWSSTVFYDEGVQPKNSEGGNFDSPLPAGSGVTINRTITGIYPYFYGKVASGGVPAGSNRPIATAALITGGTKVISGSSGTIVINFNSTADDYIWFAIPSASASKTSWYITALNNGAIGGVVSPGGNLFPNEESIAGVSTTLWSGQTYKVYISNYQTAATQLMELRN